MQITAFFWVSLVLCVLSFAMFMRFAWLASRARSTEPRVEAGDAGVQSFDPVEILKAIGTLSGQLAKSGPMATCATLCAFFAILALASSGLVKVGP